MTSDIESPLQDSRSTIQNSQSLMQEFMEPPLRIGLICEFPSLNGGEFSLLSVLDQLSETELSPVVICPDEGPLAKQMSTRGVHCVVPPIRETVESPEQFQQRWIEFLNQMIKEFDLQLLHANSLTMARRLGTVAKLLDCPTTGHLRDIIKLKPRAVRALNQHRGLVAVSRATQGFHQAQGVASEKLVTICNGIDTTRFHPTPPTGFLHRELRLSPETPLVAMIGQICLRKGQLDLAKAAVILRDHLPNLHYLMIGERHSTKTESVEYESRIADTFTIDGIGDRLHQLNFRDDIPEILNEITLLVHPARQEPLGRVLLEAAACSVPIVATNVGGTAEILTHGESAFLISAGDPAAIASGVAIAIKNPQQARSWGVAAHSEIVERFTSAAAARDLLAFWRRSL